MGMTCAVYAVPTDRIDALRRDPAREIESIRTDDEVVLPNAGLEKSWAGLHYLLTGSPGFDDAGGVTNRPLAFLLQGGHSISDGAAYGGRLFTPGETKAIDASLSAVSDDQLWSRYDPAAMESLEVYPMIWDEPEDDLREEYEAYFHELKRVVRIAAQQDMGLLVQIM